MIFLSAGVPVNAVPSDDISFSIFLLIVYLLIAIGVSFLCSMLEAVLLSVPQSHIAVLKSKGSKNGLRLESMKKDVDKPLAAILTLNTFAHTLGATGAGAQAAAIFGSAWVGLVGFIITLLILIFSEIIPKTLGAVHAKRLALPCAWIIHWLIILLYPIVAICNWISMIMTRGKTGGPRFSREEVGSLAQIALEDGSIDRSEARVLENLMTLKEITVDEIVTPRTVVFTLPHEMSVQEVMSNETPQFTRIPIVGDSLDDTKGVLHMREVYEAMVAGKGEMSLGELARPIYAVPETAKISKVLKLFMERQEHLFLVVDEFGGSRGIVTMEDILESLLGVEIVDETDPAEDMQEVARELLQDRPEVLKGMEQQETQQDDDKKAE